MGQILSINEKEMNYKFILRDETKAKGSKFRVYSHPVRTLRDVNKAYTKPSPQFLKWLCVPT
jgi:hypothetical protein